MFKKYGSIHHFGNNGVYEICGFQKSNFKLKYPEDKLILDWESGTFYSKDLQTFAVISESQNDLKNEYQKQLKLLSQQGVQITYEVLKNKSFVISGNQGNNIVYFKSIKIYGIKNFGFKMIFPRKDKQIWEPILALCANSFKSTYVDSSETVEEDTEDEVESEPMKATAVTIKQTSFLGLPPPTNFKIEAGNGMVHLAWNPMPKADGYSIRILNVSKSITEPLVLTTTNNELIVADLDNGYKYDISINCYGHGENSDNVVRSVFLPNNIIPELTATKPDKIQ
jgi:hypothetical protein